AGRTLSEDQIPALGQTMLIGIGFFVTTIAFAALIGALFGSSSANARAKETPWAGYLLAGLISVVIFFVMQLIREAVVYASGLGDTLALIRSGTLAGRLRRLGAWCLVRVFGTVCMWCLARQRAEGGECGPRQAAPRGGRDVGRLSAAAALPAGRQRAVDERLCFAGRLGFAVRPAGAGHPGYSGLFRWRHGRA